MNVLAAALHVYEWGADDAPVVVYWDGLGGCGLHANEIAPALVRDWGWRVVAPDPPGHGRSPPRVAGAFLPSALADLTAALLSRRGLRRAVFLGFSWGAEVACAFGAKHPDRTTALVLIDGGYWDFADLPGRDAATVDLASCVANARFRAAEERFTSWDDYFAAQEADLGRWSPALAAAHRATMRVDDGTIVPIAEPDTIGAIHYGNWVEPTAALNDALRGGDVPILLLTPAEGHGRVAQRGLIRFAAEVPQLEVRRLPGDVHDLVSNAPGEVSGIVGEWLRAKVP